MKKFMFGKILCGISLFFFVSCSGTKVEETNASNSPVFKEPSAVVVDNVSKFVPASTSVEFAKSMVVGWNLGNTFDATGRSGLSCETAWKQPKTTKPMIDALKKAGFMTIRIPVSWHDHIDDNYVIDSAWMNRVKEVVSWAVDDGFCVIINIHHDNMAESVFKTGTKASNGYCLSNSEEYQKLSKKYITEVWKQIADNFAEFDNQLVFEILNEPRDVGGKIWGNEWWLNDENARKVNAIITDYEKEAISVIRATGGKNANRFIMVTDYAASPDFLGSYVFPADSTADRLLLSVHAYSPYNLVMLSPGETKFTFDHQTELTNLFARLDGNYVRNGIGVVIGETGATNKNNLPDRVRWAKDFFGKTYSRGIPAVLWDNGSWQVFGTDYNEHYGYYNRTQQIWYFPEIIEAIMESVGVKE